MDNEKKTAHDSSDARDTVQVVRCRNCRFFREDRKCQHERSAWFRPDKSIRFPTVDPEDYCSWGEELAK